MFPVKDFHHNIKEQNQPHKGALEISNRARILQHQEKRVENRELRFSCIHGWQLFISEKFDALKIYLGRMYV